MLDRSEEVLTSEDSLKEVCHGRCVLSGNGSLCSRRNGVGQQQGLVAATEACTVRRGPRKRWESRVTDPESSAF